MKNPILAGLYLSPQEILKKTQIMNRYQNQLAIGWYHGAGILLRLLGPILTKAAGTNFDHFSKKFPHGRVDFV